MRRDSRAPGGREPADELLAAYIDGVSELTAGERRALDERLVSDEVLRAEAAETRDLLGKLRELPPASGEPDWAALERSIGDACGPEVPRSWWQRFGWRWAVPVVTLATGAAIAALVMREPARDAVMREPAPALAAHDRAKPDEAPAPRAEETVALWLDGEGVEVELAAEELLEVPWEGDLDQEDLLPASDLAWLEWIDELDGEALERAEAWLGAPAPEQPAQRKRS